MLDRSTRRDFLSTTFKAGAAVGLADLAAFQTLPAVADAYVKPALVQFSPDIEPLVRLIEDTQRSKLLETVVARIKQGTTYQQFLAAVMLAGVRGIRPRPVGFKFHAVLVVNSAHLASLAAPAEERWLPLLWALDNYKASQQRNQEEGGWMMPPVDESKLPTTTQAKQRFVEAMDNWDEEGTDRAVVPLVRSTGANEVMELFWRYGARDFRDIGHKAIYAANAYRTLQTIGWRHAEPVLRSLAFAMLEHEGDNPAKRDAAQDRPWRENIKRVARIRTDWQTGKITPSAAAELLAAERADTPSEAADEVVQLLNAGVDPASVWDGLFLTAGELLMRQPGIGGLHTLTTMNALHFAYQNSGNDETRRMMMLQAAAFLPMFRDFMVGRGKMSDDLRLNKLEKADVKSTGPEAVEEIFADVSKDRTLAAKKALSLLASRPDTANDLLTVGRRLVFAKGNDSHDYKFSSAVMEDCFHATTACRNRYLAASLFWLHGSGDEDNGLIKRARAALA
ncbi:MAG TPA: hypothetical protein VKE94_07725 [Gemmataceae bacterium]|nr:hypothetical protein [Gemmataceae bacterium]